MDYSKHFFVSLVDLSGVEKVNQFAALSYRGKEMLKNNFESKFGIIKSLLL